ncbi:NAD(P)/FAD-dependent oxidoreductase [Paraoerskovia marina]|uniref:NAD(P)/FAD-dependent oxidoreductase n=1 Tax=Paraoerskovia marina TaxID=545619 RepID=UPI0005BA42CC|nr:NAD(P)/FAD-dependent oxidoreductase [Paraoerskovia marina]
MSEKRYDYLILGAGMAADAAARGIREVDPDGTIGILGRETTEPVARPALSKKLWTDPEFTLDQVWLGTAEATGAELVLGEAADDVDLAARVVTTEGGREVGYERLLVTTGGDPRTLEVDDWYDSGRVIAFRTIHDYWRLREYAAAGARVAVVGGSFIAAEIAAALAQQDVEAHLICRGPAPMASILPPRVTGRLTEAMERHGVRVVTDAEVRAGEVEGSEGPVRLDMADGREARYDLVVTGLGVDPATGPLADAGLKVVDDGGIVVDERLRTSDPAVWAAGDVAVYPDQILGRTRIEHVDHAQESGKAAGRSMAGADESYTHTPYFYSVLFDDFFEAVGALDPDGGLVEDWQGEGDPLDRGVVYYGTRDGDTLDVTGVLLWNVEEARDAARAVIADGPVPVGALRGRIT